MGLQENCRIWIRHWRFLLGRARVEVGRLLHIVSPQPDILLLVAVRLQNPGVSSEGWCHMMVDGVKFDSCACTALQSLATLGISMLHEILFEHSNSFKTLKAR